jgi:hypothetical protein
MGSCSHPFAGAIDTTNDLYVASQALEHRLTVLRLQCQPRGDYARLHAISKKAEARTSWHLNSTTYLTCEEYDATAPSLRLKPLQRGPIIIRHKDNIPPDDPSEIQAWFERRLEASRTPSSHELQELGISLEQEVEVQSTCQCRLSHSGALTSLRHSSRTACS